MIQTMAEPADMGQQDMTGKWSMRIVCRLLKKIRFESVDQMDEFFVAGLRSP